jgi:uncharacterized protein
MRMTRRGFLAGIGAAGAAVGADAFGFEAHRVLVSRHDVRVNALPSALEGVRIVQISDVHLPGNQLAARAALEHVDRERPEIVILTGDLTESGQNMTQLRDFAAEAKGSFATIALLGNWEYRAGLENGPAREAYRNAGVDLLVNAAKTIDVGGVPLTLVGLDDAVAGRPDLIEARRAVVSGATEIWLIHSPIFAEHPPDGVVARPIMMLAGHTHGGQIRIPLLPAVKPVGAGRFLEGWYRDTFAPLYVSRGIGTTGIPARFRCPAELPIFTLRSA